MVKKNGAASKTLDVRYMGTEPTITSIESRKDVNLAKALNWYNYMHDAAKAEVAAKERARMRNALTQKNKRTKKKIIGTRQTILKVPVCDFEGLPETFLLNSDNFERLLAVGVGFAYGRFCFGR